MHIIKNLVSFHKVQAIVTIGYMLPGPSVFYCEVSSICGLPRRPVTGLYFYVYQNIVYSFSGCSFYIYEKKSKDVSKIMELLCHLSEI